MESRKKRHEWNKVNKLNHSAAILAQITHKVNSKPETPMPPLGAFLPYPLALDSHQILDCSAVLLSLILSNRHRLSPELASVLDEEQINAKITGSYYWKSNLWMYE